MKKIYIKIIFLISGIIIYDYLFWKQKLGVNILISSLILLLFLFADNPLKKISKFAIITGTGTIISAGMVMINNSVASVFAFITSFIVFTGFWYYRDIRSILAALPSGVLNFFVAPKQLLNTTKQFVSLPKNAGKILRIFRLTIIPIVVLITFYIIFSIANPKFNDLMVKLFEDLFLFFKNIFCNFPLLRFLFILSGIFLITGIIFYGNIRLFVNKDVACKNIIIRKRSRQYSGNKKFKKNKTLGLKDENRTAVILIILVNILVIIENIIDINWIWFGFEYDNDKNLSQLVHEGTYLLIISILLSIGILLYFFRGNQNFYKKNKILKYGAYFWIIQNVILVISVALRNLYYIRYYGLAYKRIGVIIFLILVFGGLILLYIKIREKKSAYYLLRLNSWNIYFMMIFIALFNWDVLIAKYNVRQNYQSPVDMFYLFSLSDKSLHVLHNNWENLISANKEYSWTYLLNKRIDTFMEKKENSSWQSWNYAEHKTYRYFLRDLEEKKNIE